MKTDMKKLGLVLSMVVTAGLGLTACDTPDEAIDDEVSLRSDAPVGLPQHVRGLITANKITPIAAPPTVSPAMFALGEALFYDKILSGTRDVACATCHAPQFASADARTLNAGINGSGVGPARTGLLGGRHTQPLFNLHLLPGNLTIDSKVELINGLVSPLGLGTSFIPYPVQQLLGFDVVNTQAILPIATGQEMLGFPDPADHNEVGDCAPFDLGCVWGAYMVRIKAIPQYQTLFTAAFPNRPWAQIGITEVGVAIGSYEYAAFSFDDSPWDRFVAGDNAALSPAALRGAVTFFTPGKGNCVACHSGNAFTDLKFHKTLTPQFGPGGTVPGGDGPGGLDDFGRERNSHNRADRYAWRTPPLRGVELTAPYGRLGQYTELEDHILHYINPTQSLLNYDITQLDQTVLHGTLLNNTQAILAEGVDPLLSTVHITPADVPDLVAFLYSLTDDAERDLNHLIPATVPSGLPVDQ
ncbi:MAG TPA: cytochrome c peroxidase [Nannocystis sp.]